MHSSRNKKKYHVPPQTIKLSPETEHAISDLASGASLPLVHVIVVTSRMEMLATDGPDPSPPKRIILVPLYAM